MIEIGIYILIAIALFGYRTVISGKKNGCFYFKNVDPKPDMLKREISNLHFLETPAWYCQSGGIFILTFALTRALHPTIDTYTLIGLASSLLITIGSYTFPNYWYQRGVTGGTKSDDELDSYDGDKSEVAIFIFGKKIQFWKKQLFYNSRRKLAIYIGIIEILTGIYLLSMI